MHFSNAVISLSFVPEEISLLTAAIGLFDLPLLKNYSAIALSSFAIIQGETTELVIKRCLFLTIFLVYY